MKEPLIRDIQSIRKTLEDCGNYIQLKDAMPLLRPLLKCLSDDTYEMDDALKGIDSVAKEVEALSLVPDTFNDLFAERGWIIYERMSLVVVNEAIAMAKSGDFDYAENHLTDYYSVETIKRELTAMNAITSFRPRANLLNKALIDYEEERYHACVPVVLALLDGLVTELHENRYGFFAEKTSLTAWDSIAAHSRGLNVLSSIFKKGRYTTRTERITIPYRNGIMHGMDLGYDNKIVAAKAWAALFASRDWEIKAERGCLDAPPEEPNPSWIDIFKQLHANENLKKLQQLWKPREVSIGREIPQTGKPDMFQIGTPEKMLAEFFTYWKARNYGYMAERTNPHYSGASISPSEIRSIYETKFLKSFEFVDITDDAPAITTIQAKIIFEEYDTVETRSYSFRMLCLDTKGHATVREQLGSTWSVQNWELS